MPEVATASSIAALGALPVFLGLLARRLAGCWAYASTTAMPVKSLTTA
jgi:hypothetical protein